MIALTAAALDLIQGRRYTTHWRLLIEDADGTMRDYSDQGGIDWRKSVDWGKTVDSPMADGSVEVFREAGGYSLAPQVEGSTLNRNAAGNYAPAIDIGRRLEVWTQDTPAGAAAVAGDWVLVHDAIIQKLGKGSDSLKLSTLDRASLLNRIIRHANTYGTSAGTPVADVMQALIDDTLGVGVFTLALDGDPQYAIAEAGPFTGRSLWDALEALSAEFGGYLEYRAALTLVTPDRTTPTAASAVATIGPDQYKALPRLDTDLADIRNDIDVTFRNASTGAAETVNAVDAASVTAYGEQFMGITLAEGSAIDTTAEAQNMADKVLADLSVPRFSQQVVNWYWFPVELGDHITWEANGRDYDSDQHWAVTGFRHRLDKDKRETVFDVRGAASGGYKRWLRRGDDEGAEEPTAGPPFAYSLDPTQSGSTGTLAVSISDPSKSVTAVEFQKRAGAGAFGGTWLLTWDASTGVAGTDTSLSRSERVALKPKHTSAIKVRISYTDTNGNAQTLVDSHTFDLNTVAEITEITPDIDNAGNVYVGLVGDEDTANLYIRVTTDGTTPTNPTSASNDGSVTGRSGRTAATGKTASSGTLVKVKAVAYDGAGVAGPVQSKEWSVPNEPGAEKNPPRIYNAECDGFWNGTGTDYTVTWSSSNTKGGETVDIILYRGQKAVATVTGTANDGTHSQTVSGGSSSDRVAATVKLKDSGGTVIDTDKSMEEIQRT